MNKIDEIYRCIVQETEEMREHRQKVDQYIESILEDYKERVKEKEYEMCRDRFYQVALKAEEGGFCLGFRYAVCLMAECYTEKITVKSE